MIKKFLFLTILITFSLNSSLFAEFDELGTSARAVGMGDAFVAIADDTYAIVYNPAGLGALHHKEFATNSNMLYAGLSDMSSLNESFVGGIYGTEKYGTLGLGYKWFNAGNLYKETSIYVSYGKYTLSLFNAPIFMGASFKMLSKQYSSDLYTENSIDFNGNAFGRDPVFANGYSKSGISYDFGLYSPFSENYSAGIAVKNINSPDMGLASADIVPMTIKAGICYKYDKLSVPFEIENTQADNVFSSGFERWFYSDQLAVRSGLQIGTRNLANISAGLSYSYRNSVRLDYGFSFPLQGIKNTYGSHRFSLVFLFDKGGSKSQTKPQIKSQVKLDEKIKPNTSKFDKAVKLYKKNELIRAYDLFKEVSILNRDPKLRTDSIKHVNIIVKKLKAVQEKRALDKRYYYADGLLNYMYNKYSDALRSWKEYIKLDKNNSEVNQYINDLQKAQDLF